MLDTDCILISEELDIHNALVEKILESGFYIAGRPSKDGLNVGHINVKKPKSDHHSYNNNDLPVAYADCDKILLANTEYETLREYHDQLIVIIGEFMSS